MANNAALWRHRARSVFCTYSPDPHYFGSDSFTFKANDSALDSNVSTVSITVTEINNDPSAVNDNKETAEDSSLNFAAGDLTGNDSAGPNEGAQTLTVDSVISTVNTHGSINLSAGQITYTPDTNYNGPASFDYHMCDDGTTNGAPDPKCATGTVNVTVNAVNDPPVAGVESYSTNSNVTLNVPAPGVLSNDTDIDSGALSAVLVSDVSNGTLTLNPNGSFSYSPNLDFEGSDSFTYHAYDGAAYSNVVTVTITVNDTVAPVLTSSVDISLITTTNSNLINVGLAASATDNSGDLVTIQVAVFGDEDDQTPTFNNVLHSPDAKDIAPITLRLRGERIEANDGRVYLIVITATDSSGNISRNYQTVVVPKNNKQASIDSVNAQAAAAITYAQTHGGAAPAGYFVIGDGPVIGPKQ